MYHLRLYSLVSRKFCQTNNKICLQLSKWQQYSRLLFDAMEGLRNSCFRRRNTINTGSLWFSDCGLSILPGFQIFLRGLWKNNKRSKADGMVCISMQQSVSPMEDFQGFLNQNRLLTPIWKLPRTRHSTVSAAPTSLSNK